MAIVKSGMFISFLWKLSERCSVQLITFIVTIILARLLSPEEYGTIALITIIIALAEVITDGGFNTALIQKKDADDIDFSTIFFFSIILASILYFFLFISAPFIAIFFNDSQLTPVIRVLGISLFFYAINSIQKAYIARNMLFKNLFISSFIAVTLSGAIGITLAYNGGGIWALVAQIVSIQTINVFIMWFSLEWRPIFTFSRERFKDLFSFGWKIFCTNFMIILFVKSRALIIGKLFSPSTLAFYDKGNQFPALIMDNVCGSIQAVIFPTLSKIQDQREQVKETMKQTISISCLFMFPIMVGLIVCAKPLVIFLLTDKWLGVVPFMQILCIAYFFTPITIPNQQAITALGYSNITLKLETIRKILDVIILAISCCLGAIEIAWGVVVFNFICIFINLYPNIKLLDYSIQDQILDILPTLTLSIVMGSIIWWLNFLPLHPFPLIILITSLGTIIYFALCYMLKIEAFQYFLTRITKK